MVAAPLTIDNDRTNRVERLHSNLTHDNGAPATPQCSTLFPATFKPPSPAWRSSSFVNQQRRHHPRMVLLAMLEHGVSERQQLPLRQRLECASPHQCSNEAASPMAKNNTSLRWVGVELMGRGP